MTPILEIINNGPDLLRTNFFDSEYAENGYYYLSTYAGCVRLLIPGNQKGPLKELKDVSYVILFRGPCVQRGVSDAIELLFEDFSDSSYAIHMTIQQCDMLPDGEGEWILALWVRSGKKMEFPLKYRKVDETPCLKSWMEMPESGYYQIHSRYSISEIP